MVYDTRHSARRTVTADDGRVLPLTTYEPSGHPVGVVLVVPAMATPSRFYAPFARWLAGRGHRVVTFDYRGTRSVEEMRAETGDVDRWFADVRVILDAVADDAGELPVTWIGHSLGGQMVPFVDHTRLASVITVSAGDGYWRRNAPSIRWKAPLLWGLVAPIAMRVAGYYPGSRLRVVGDVPSGPMRQWGRWCRHPEYLQVDHPEAPTSYAEVKAPLMSLSFTDDELLSGDSIRHLHDWYTGADQVRQRYSPEQLDGRRVGHHGFFRKENADLWEELLLPWVATAG